MKTVETISLLTLIALTLACGYSSKNYAPAPGAMPAIALLNPGGATAGGDAFTLTVNGSNFAAKAVVNWNGVAQTANTTYVSGNQLTVRSPGIDDCRFRHCPDYGHESGHQWRRHVWKRRHGSRDVDPDDLHHQLKRSNCVGTAASAVRRAYPRDRPRTGGGRVALRRKSSPAARIHFMRRPHGRPVFDALAGHPRQHRSRAPKIPIVSR